VTALSDEIDNGPVLFSLPATVKSGLGASLVGEHLLNVILNAPAPVKGAGVQ
jgi:hypothetical protein